MAFRVFRSSRILFLGFQSLMALALAISFLPVQGGGPLGSIQTQVSRNSEAFALCLLVSFELRLRTHDDMGSWFPIWWAFLAAGYFGTELISGLPAPVATLNEAFLGALVISMFLTVFHPSNTGRWRWRWLFPIGAAAVALIGELPIGAFNWARPWIMGSAESLGFVILITILFGCVSGYPWPEGLSSVPRRVVWLMALVVIPIGVALVNPNGVDSIAAVGVLESAMVWIQRITEAFIAAVLLTIYCQAQARLSGSAERKEPLPS